MMHTIAWLITLFFPLTAGLFGMLSAQCLKVVIGLVKAKKMDFSPFTNAGGMPSSHTAMVTALSCSLGLKDGWTSAGFAISVIFSLIVLYDAAGVRYAAGRQATVLNRVQKVLNSQGYDDSDTLKETLGHTKFEIVIGVCLGMAVSFGLFFAVNYFQ